MLLPSYIVALPEDSVALMNSGSRWDKCQLSIYVVVAAEIWVNCLCPTYPPPRSWWSPHPGSCQRPLHIPQGTSSQPAFITCRFLFLFWPALKQKSLGYPRILLLPPPASFFLLLLPLITAPLFALICPQFFALTGRGSFPAGLAKTLRIISFCPGNQPTFSNIKNRNISLLFFSQNV